jgi:two-component sensor histidine kinase
LEEEQKKLQDANVDLETSIEQEKQARIREKEQIDKLAEVKKQEEEKLIYHRRQITHLTRGALLNQVLEFQSIKDLSTDSLKTPYEEIVMRLNSTLEFLRYIDKNSSDDPKRINIQRYLNNSIEKYSKSVPNITIDYSNIDLESYKEINTENAVRIVCSLLELTTNAVKSINKTLCSNPLVVINAINTGTSLEISVIDNGEGGYFSKEYQGESGFGTQYLNLLVKKHFNGDWVVTPNSPLSGSVAKIIISNNKIL